MRRTAARVLGRRRTSLADTTAARTASSLVGGGAAVRSTPVVAQRVYKNPFLPSSHKRDDDNDTAVAPEPLLALGPSYELFPNDVHCFLGLNGSGKSRFLHELQELAASQEREHQNHQSDDATTSEQPRRPRCRVASLSLDAHREFVARHGDKVVANVLGGVGSPSARDLIVRLGLYPVWESRVQHLSTGEMRKLMLAETLLAVPRANVLILDQPFDGLDVAARKQLEWMLGQLTRGFTRLLVNTGGRNDALAYRTQVLLVANRLEQVFPEILTHMVLLSASSTSSNGQSQHVTQRSDDSRSTSVSGMKIMPCASVQDSSSHDTLLAQLHAFFDAERQKQPAMAPSEIVALVQELFDCSAPASSSATSELRELAPAVALRQVSIAYDRRVLLESIDFERQRHEHWVLLGPNGSGKSSLMRVLMQTPGHGLTSGDVFLGSDKISAGQEYGHSHQCQQGTGCISAVSTDQHIHLLHESIEREKTDSDAFTGTDSPPRVSAFDLITANAKSPTKAQLAAALLRLDVAAMQARSFAELSQGEQKLVLIARALAACPEVLLLDEITHGLDPFNRAHVLDVVNAIGLHARAATHLVLITHHEDEIVACFGDRVFEIRDKKLVARAASEGTQ